MHPDNISSIWEKIRARCFRIRNVETLEDYFVTGIPSFTQGLPWYAQAVKCDGEGFTSYCFDCWTKKWALLSTKEESKWFEQFAENRAKFQAKIPYRISDRREKPTRNLQ